MDTPNTTPHEPTPIPAPAAVNIKRRKPWKRPPSARQRDRKYTHRDRLPDGTTVAAIWDAARGVWVGALSVPAGEGRRAEFRGERTGLFDTLESLDDQYRGSLTSAATAVAAVPPAKGGAA